MKHGSQTTPLHSRLAAPGETFHKETQKGTRQSHVSCPHMYSSYTHTPSNRDTPTYTAQCSQPKAPLAHSWEGRVVTMVESLSSEEMQCGEGTAITNKELAGPIKQLGGPLLWLLFLLSRGWDCWRNSSKVRVDFILRHVKELNQNCVFPAVLTNEMVKFASWCDVTRRQKGFIQHTCAQILAQLVKLTILCNNTSIK